MVAYFFKKNDKDLKTMTDDELMSGAKKRRTGNKIVRYLPMAGGIAATLVLFQFVAMPMLVGFAASMAVGWGVNKISAPWVNKVSSRLSTEFTTMEREMLDRMDKREKAEKAAEKAATLQAKAEAAAHEAAGTRPLVGQAAEDFKQAKAAGMPTTEDITVRKGTLKFKKPGENIQP